MTLGSNDELQLPDVVGMTRKMVANQGRRFSVSVERVDPSTLDTSAAVVPKTSEQQKRLDQAIAKVMKA